MRRGLKRFLLGGLVLAGVLLVAAVIGYFVWLRHVDERLAYWQSELEKMGRPLTLEEILPDPIPDEDNAAIPVVRYLSEYDNSDPFHEDPLFEFEERWVSDYSRQEVVTAAKALAETPRVQTLLEIIHTLPDYPKYQYPYDLSRGLAMEVPDLRVQRAMQQACHIMASIAFHQGQYKDGYKWLLKGYLHPDTYKGYVPITCKVIRSSMSDTNSTVFLHALDANWLNTESAKSILAQLKPHQPLNREELLMGIETDRLAILSAYFPFSKRLESIAEFDDGVEQDTFTVARAYVMWALFAKADLAKVYELQVLHTAELSKRRPDLNYISEQTDKILSGQFVEQIYPITYITSGVENFTFIFDKAEARFNLLRATLALYVYRLEKGEYPETLDALVPGYLEAVPYDPFADAPLTYHPQGDSYQLYSIGALTADPLTAAPIVPGEKDEPVVP